MLINIDFINSILKLNTIISNLILENGRGIRNTQTEN
jgi:hypothetical protein